jgi:hypothetical protein
MPWEGENERLGFRACTRRGYNLLGVGEYTALAGVILLWGVIAYVLGRGQAHFSAHDLWWLLPPAAVIVAGQVISRIGWWLAERKQFHYDYDSNSVTWIEQGRTFVYPETSEPPGRE